MPNCPLRGAYDIAQAFEALQARRRSFQMSLVQPPGVSAWWAMKPDGERRLQPLFEGVVTQRSQDLPATYFPSGSIWIARKAEMRAAGTFYGEGVAGHPVGWRAAVDIDTEEDLIWGRNLARLGD